MSFYDPFDDDAAAPPVGPRPGWKLRRLDADPYAAPAPPPLAPGEYPADIVALAALLEVEPAFIMRNPRNYTPPTCHAPLGAGGYLDPDKLVE
jgi:hypothetical protein